MKVQKRDELVVTSKSFLETRNRGEQLSYRASTGAFNKPTPNDDIENDPLYKVTYGTYAGGEGPAPTVTVVHTTTSYSKKSQPGSAGKRKI